MTGITENGIEIDRTVAADPEQVFAALTTAESFAQWFGTRAVDVPIDRLDYRAEPGRRWAAVMVLPDGNAINWAGEFVEVDAPTRLMMTLTDQPEAENGALLSIDLTRIDAASGAGSGTQLRAQQEAPGFSDEQKLATIAGWEGFLDVLAEIAEA